jgi:signal transduction histidine kinase
MLRAIRSEIVTRVTWRYLVRVVLLALAYAAGAHLGVLLASSHSPVTAVWLPSGIAAAGLLMSGRRSLPGVALGSCIAVVTTGGSLGVAAVLWVGPVLEAAAVLYICSHPLFQIRREFDRVQDVAALLLASTVAPVFSATVGTLTLSSFGRLPWTEFWGAWATWWVGDALGILLLTPMLLTWQSGRLFKRERTRTVEAGVLVVSILAVSWVAFAWSPPAAFVLAPLLTVTAVRFGPRGAATSLFVVAAVAIAYTFRGIGPFATAPLDDGLLTLQVFVAVGTVTILSLAAASTERDRVQQALRQARDELEDKVAERTERLRQANERLAGELRERQRAEDERRQFEDQLRQSQKLESLGVLAGGIAHDFNNLLTAILGHADLAQTGLPPDSPLRVHIDEINTASRRAADLAGQMLAYSGRAQRVIKPVRLSKVVRELGQLLEASVSKKAPLTYRLDADLPVIEADPTQLRQVVMNLIINASEAIGDAAGTVTVTTRVADVPASAPGGTWIGGTPPPGRYVAFEVADTGCGMNAGTLSRIFDPFFTTKVTGRGLGLALVLGIVRGHAGYLAVDSAPDHGTVFAILFPPSAHIEETGAANDGATPAASWTGRGTVLIVDDEPAVRRLAKVMVERCGFDTLLAEDGEEALRVFRANQGVVTGVLLDLSMPRMGGRETLCELRRLDPGVPILLSSGYPEQDPVPGATGFVQKPYRLATLSEALRAALSLPA